MNWETIQLTKVVNITKYDIAKDEICPSNKLRQILFSDVQQTFAEGQNLCNKVGGEMPLKIEQNILEELVHSMPDCNFKGKERQEL